MPPIFLATAAAYPDDIKPLTAIRFYAALVVALNHIFYLLAEYNPAIGDFLVFFPGHLAVDFFFILSGFILTHVYNRAFSRREISKTSFIIKRLARIYPVHVFTLFSALLLSYLLVATGNEQRVWEDNSNATFILNLALIQAWGFSPGPSFNAPSWSNSAEFFAYLLFPFILAMTYKRPFPAATYVVGAIAILMLFWIAAPFLSGGSLTELTFNFGIMRIFPEFIFGIALYLWGQSNRIFWTPLRITIAAFTLGLSVLFQMHIFIVLSFGILIISLAEISRSRSSQALSGTLQVWIGKISYAFYMLHAQVITLLSAFFLKTPSSVALQIFIMIFALIVTFTLSAILHQLLEVPARHWITRSFTLDARQKQS